jgi:CelD/BcsL family acetyltransferase involved in cellulose biosynthesis
MMWAAGFDPDQKRWSPGIVLFALAIRAAIDEGAKYFDLLRGQSRYKSELGVTDYPLHRLTLRPVSLV